MLPILLPLLVEIPDSTTTTPHRQPDAATEGTTEGTARSMRLLTIIVQGVGPPAAEDKGISISAQQAVGEESAWRGSSWVPKILN